MDFAFPDGNVSDLLASRNIDTGQDVTRKLQIHSSLVRRLSLEQELEGHQGCVNALAWNSNGSLLISGSDDARVNIWSYASKSLVCSIGTGHSANIFCTKFVPATCDELVVSGAGDAEVRLFRVSRLSGSSLNTCEPSALFRCHSRRVKKLAVEDGNPNVVWSASEDGTLRQHDFREGVSCPPDGSSHQECRNILLDLRSGAKRSLADNPRHCLGLKSCDISPTRPHQLLIGGSDAFGRLYDRRMLPPLSSSEKRLKPPPCVNYFCPVHLSDHGRPSLHLTHVTFSPNGKEVLLSYSGEHVYLMDVNPGGDCDMRYRATDVSKQMMFDSVSNVDKAHLPAAQIMPCETKKSWETSSMARKCDKLLQYARKCLEEESDYLYAIEACSEVLDGKGYYVEDALRHEFLCTRAALLLKREWKNDVHMAIRDCKKAWAINPSSLNAHCHMAEALSQLGKCKDALEYATVAQSLAPSNAKSHRLLAAAASSSPDRRQPPPHRRQLPPPHRRPRSSPAGRLRLSTCPLVACASPLPSPPDHRPLVARAPVAAVRPPPEPPLPSPVAARASTSTRRSSSSSSAAEPPSPTVCHRRPLTPSSAVAVFHRPLLPAVRLAFSPPPAVRLTSPFSDVWLLPAACRRLPLPAACCPFDHRLPSSMV
ncbi:WD and tetratricopeptide repeats protein 1 [Nymphaea thermarum]|nr:WD and tetratricopeptide repeats protein 1 [Nymphaea thermarum]